MFFKIRILLAAQALKPVGKRSLPWSPKHVQLTACTNFFKLKNAATCLMTDSLHIDSSKSYLAYLTKHPMKQVQYFCGYTSTGSLIHSCLNLHTSYAIAQSLLRSLIKHDSIYLYVPHLQTNSSWRMVHFKCKYQKTVEFLLIILQEKRERRIRKRA